MPALEKDYSNEDVRISSSQQITRRYILVLYWAVIICVLPLWWMTTSIERLSIPESRVLQRSNQEVKFPVNIQLVGTSSQVSTIAFALRERTKSNGRLWKQMDVNLKYNLDASKALDYRIAIELGNGPISVDGRSLVWRSSNDFTTMDADFIIELLEGILLPTTSSVQAQYAPRYRLAFSLLNEDCSQGGAVLSWELEQAIEKYLSPALDKLGVLHTFTIESQVQYHARLAFEPPSRTSAANESRVDYELDQDQLKTFVNSAEWTLASSVNNDLVLHFLVFIPSIEHRPMFVLRPEVNAGGRSTTNAFLVPQWGGITVLNPLIASENSNRRANHHLTAAELAPIFSIIRSQLYALLGVPSLPQGIIRSGKTDPSGLGAWQLDALLRRRTHENAHGARDTLGSIVKLVHQIDNMPIHADVREDVTATLDALDNVFATGDQRLSLQDALIESSTALTLSSRAFFNPGMLAMLYFPAEHNAAVYTPLFFPLAVPLVIMSLKEVIAWRKSRRQARETAAAAVRQRLD